METCTRGSGHLAPGRDSCRPYQNASGTPSFLLTHTCEAAATGPADSGHSRGKPGLCLTYHQPLGSKPALRERQPRWPRPSAEEERSPPQSLEGNRDASGQLGELAGTSGCCIPNTNRGHRRALSGGCGTRRHRVRGGRNAPHPGLDQRQSSAVVSRAYQAEKWVQDSAPCTRTERTNGVGSLTYISLNILKPSAPRTQSPWEPRVRTRLPSPRRGTPSSSLRSANTPESSVSRPRAASLGTRNGALHVGASYGARGATSRTRRRNVPGPPEARGRGSVRPARRSRTRAPSAGSPQARGAHGTPSPPPDT